MNTEFIREGNRTLYCFSIFYAQDEWGRILPLLHTYMMSNPDIHQYMFFLSYERGEHIRLIYRTWSDLAGGCLSGFEEDCGESSVL